MNLDTHKTETLMDMLAVFEGNGGSAIIDLVSDMMQGPINMVLKTEEDADRNRGRVDAFQMMMRIPVSIKQELEYRNKKMQESQE